MPGGGYCLTPAHQLQDNSPVENVIAMYIAAHITSHTDMGRRNFSPVRSSEAAIGLRMQDDPNL